MDKLKLCFKIIPDDENKLCIFGINQMGMNPIEVNTQIELLALCVNDESAAEQIRQNGGYFKGTTGGVGNAVREVLNAELKTSKTPLDHYKTLKNDEITTIPTLSESNLKQIDENVYFLTIHGVTKVHFVCDTHQLENFGATCVFLENKQTLVFFDYIDSIFSESASLSSAIEQLTSIKNAHTSATNITELAHNPILNLIRNYCDSKLVIYWKNFKSKLINISNKTGKIEINGKCYETGMNYGDILRIATGKKHKGQENIDAEREKEHKINKLSTEDIKHIIKKLTSKVSQIAAKHYSRNQFLLGYSFLKSAHTRIPDEAKYKSLIRNARNALDTTKLGSLDANEAETYKDLRKIAIKICNGNPGKHSKTAEGIVCIGVALGNYDNSLEAEMGEKDALQTILKLPNFIKTLKHATIAKQECINELTRLVNSIDVNHQAFINSHKERNR